MRKRMLVVAAALLAGVVAVGCAPVERLVLRPMEPPEALRGAAADELPDRALRTVVEDLDTPWELAFLPDGGILVTERPGRLLRLPPPRDATLSRSDASVWEIDGVVERGEGGLMGLALHPDFGENGWVYLMLTARGADGLENRVERYRLDEAAGPVDRSVIVGGIPGARFHNGGRIAFGPDGHLYVSTGDAGDPELSQDPASPAGKILRVTDEGAVPDGNPFGLQWWSYGHRNAQGLAWDDEDRLWSTEHGRSGLRTGLDELNVIEPGGNYGWPVIEGDEEREGMIGPAAHSGPEYVWAPAGAAWLEGRLYFGGLRGEALYEARLDGDRVEAISAYFAGELGRIRAVVVGSDGALYLGTSNRDGRGRVREGDDRVVRLEPDALPR